MAFPIPLEDPVTIATFPLNEPIRRTSVPVALLAGLAGSLYHPPALASAEPICYCSPMSIRLDQTVPFGRSLGEYELMFSLSASDRERRILDCAAGPASFNAELTAAGGTVYSCDPLYQFTGAEIQRQFFHKLDQVMDQIRATPENWVWRYHRSPDELRQRRIDVMERFLVDYRTGQGTHRYVCGALPALPFARDQFDLALSSHFLFLYSDHFSQTFHLESIRALTLVAREVRIFPLIALRAERSQHLKPVYDQLQREGYRVSIEPVEYELQRGGHEMLRVWRR